MKKIIGGKVYDTDTAKEIGCGSYSNSMDFSHWSETLYRKKTGEYFLYGEGGPMSRYAETVGLNQWSGGCRFMPMTVEEAREWAEQYLDGDEYESVFGAVEEDDSRRVVTYSISVTAAETLRRLSAERGVSQSAMVEALILGKEI